MLEAPDLDNTWLPPPRLDDRDADFFAAGEATFKDQYAAPPTCLHTHSFYYQFA
jgi:hypothetical protein